jgi:hypothetical protein
MKRSRDWIDVYNWVLVVIDSSQTFDQLITSMRLADLWLKQNQHRPLIGHLYEQLLLIKTTKLHQLKR